MEEPSNTSTSREYLEKPRKRRRKIPMPSFASDWEEGDKRDNTVSHNTQCRELSLTAGNTASTIKPHSRNVDNKPHSYNFVETDATKDTAKAASASGRPPQAKRKESQIAAGLPYQPYRRQWDPSIPKYFTRKERKLMNDETPDKNEESPPLSRSSKNNQPALGVKAAPWTFSSPPVSQEQAHGACIAKHFENAKEDSPERLLETQKMSPTEQFPSPEIQQGMDHRPTIATLEAPHLPLPDNDEREAPPVEPKVCALIPQKPNQTKTPVSRKNCHQSQSTTSNPQTAGSTSNAKNSPSKPAALPKEKHTAFRLFFVERGRDMHADILVGPKAIARSRGAVVLDCFDKRITDNPLHLPTHFVVGAVRSPEVVSQALGFSSVEDLRYFMYEHRIQCATRAWAAQVSKEPYKEPRRATMLQGVSYQELYAPLAPLRRPRSSPSAIVKTARPTSKPTHPTKQRNVALGKLFKKLSKAYQAAPLDQIDNWRSYTFSTTASRVQALPFEIDGEASLKRVKTIKGFGSSTMEIMREFIENRLDDEDNNAENVSDDNQITCKRLQDVISDPQRLALRTMMNIWGVGRVKALELVNAGYTTIEEIRSDFKHNRLRVALQRNQFIGLMCYEDIMEEMERSEVEHIASIVAKAAKDYYSQAEIQLMGSYRRGNESCGDADILMVHPKFAEKVPPHALGRIIDNLRKEGHVAYHLTQLAGMDTDAFETLPRDVANRLGQPSVLAPKRDKDACSSYMGVFFSPVHPGKKRRVDIKFYPYRERIFASLYFTGNGYFNRSMRLWARRKFGYTLSDHGMFADSTERVRVMDALDERQIFRRLGLVWKETTERDGFDAVIGIDSKRATDLEDWSKEEFRQEERDHAWIK